MCNLYFITTYQAAIIALFRVMNHYVGTCRRCSASSTQKRCPMILTTEEECDCLDERAMG
jgi:hypothetical protein